MNEDFVTYELAVKLKEKGFKEKCIAYYWEKINEHTPSFLVEDNMPEDGLNILDLLSSHNQAEWSPFIDAPTISQVLKWLREEKKIHIEVMFIGPTPSRVKYYITNIGGGRSFMDVADEHYETWEQATLAGIEYVLDNLILL